MASSSLQLELPSGRSIEAVVTPRRLAKRLTMRVDPIKRRVVVSGPMRVSKRETLSFLTQNATWIDARLDALPARSPFIEGGEILFRGRSTKLVRRDGRGAAHYSDGGEPFLEVAAHPDRFAARTIAALKAYAQSDALSYSDALSAQLGKVPRSLVLRDTRSRWGSCTSQGDLMLNWRLIGAPPRVFEYVVAHELAHLVELNHSPRFWAQVEALMPDWKPARSWLKSNGALLQALGD